ncbi:catechol 2,3-dioxygenase-like lactoylglutathione lyase family enzyme [Mycolicibacterium iranicum]|uniref:Catechol 2,3-dioxygenase-like lactoylglutathione lyase family enzyme n=1 Tax=Mycolicibacterium iranicum TaxID=912594 RepID=A0A839Q3N6_MYCIR|nr:VOC family protein [Mycolicibacterium iranicum]MBB2988846.1 catechol 2,3-dioxygenase-like lactoylglutathione lyase family enzyme [Mycolicibacterium iranicum]
MPTTTVPVLPCADPDATVVFYEGLGFTVTHRQHRPYLYLAFRLDEIEVHFVAASPGLYITAENSGGFLAFVDDVAPVHARFVETLRDRLGGVPATGLPRLTRLRPGQTRFVVYDPSGNGITVINRDEPDVEYGGSKQLSGLAKAHDNVRIFRDFKNDDALAARALDTALRRHRADAPRLDLARALADRAELAVALGDRQQADASRAELEAMGLTHSEMASLTTELTALAQIEDWMQGA